MSELNWTTLDGAEVTHTTELAVLVSLADGEHWIPRSVCMDGDEISAGDRDVVVKSWFAIKEGLE